MSDVPEPFEPQLEPGVVEEMQARLRTTRWPRPVTGGGWEWGVDLAYLRSLCAWWADEYDPDGLLERLGEWPSYRWRGLHLLHARAEGDGLPVLLIHGWPGAPLEFRGVVGPLLAAGHDVVVPTLPGYGFSEAGDPPLGAIAVAERLAELMAALGYRRYAVQGGDWGAFVGARLAFAEPGAVAAFHCNAPGLLPPSAELAGAELSEAELAFVGEAQRLRSQASGVHMLVHSRIPDALGVGLQDSPAALAAWLVPRYRMWSDCGGEIERRFGKRDLCDFLSFYWLSASAAGALRLYEASALDRWRLQPGERIAVPVAVADFPAEMTHPPREWTERVCTDLRRWSEMPRGGHFAAWEEPALLAADLIEFLDEL